MNMIDALQFAAHQAEQQAAREQARAARQEGAEALAAVRAAMLAEQMAKGASALPVDSSTTPAGYQATQPTGDPDAPRPVLDSARKTRAREAPACADQNALAQPVPSRTMVAHPPSRYDPIINELARLSLPFANSEAWKLLLEAGKSRGLSAIEATNLRPRIWKARKALQRAEKSRLRALARSG